MHRMNLSRRSGGASLPSPLQRLLSTEPSRALLFQRLTLGVVMFPHGAQKLLGWWGGFGFDRSMRYFSDVVHLPAPLGFLVIVAESFGALALMLGALTRVAAAGIAVVMAGALVTTHLANGFFMNWFGNQAGEGMEFDLLLFGLALPLAVLGGGSTSVDGRVARS